MAIPFRIGPPGRLSSSGEVKEIVFFGRLEVRKGLLLFLEACRHLGPMPLAFVGKDEVLPGGRRASAVVRQALAGRPFSLHTNLDQEQALAYLRQPGRVCVLPSLADNLPFALIECGTQGIPFLASAVGGIPELLSETDRKRLLFPPTAVDLLACLREYLDSSPGQRRSWAEALFQRLDPIRNNDRLAEGYILRNGPALPSSTGKPLVSVIVPHYNTAAYLPEALNSLANQTYPRLDVVVVDDGSTCPRALQVLQEQERTYPHFRFLRTTNHGPGAARNVGLAEARGEAVLMFDSDNIALPHLIETLVRGLERLPDVAALTCPVLGVSDEPDPERRKPLFVNYFAGGPILLSCLENVFGDSTALYRTSALRAVGGFDTDRSTPWEDWLTYLRLIRAGFRIDSVPMILFHYRVRRGSYTGQLIRGPADRERHVAGAAATGLLGSSLAAGSPPGRSLGGGCPVRSAERRAGDAWLSPAGEAGQAAATLADSSRRAEAFLPGLAGCGALDCSFWERLPVIGGGWTVSRGAFRSTPLEWAILPTPGRPVVVPEGMPPGWRRPAR